MATVSRKLQGPFQLGPWKSGPCGITWAPWTNPKPWQLCSLAAPLRARLFSPFTAHDCKDNYSLGIFMDKDEAGGVSDQLKPRAKTAFGDESDQVRLPIAEARRQVFSAENQPVCHD